LEPEVLFNGEWLIFWCVLFRVGVSRVGGGVMAITIELGCFPTLADR
jgi:hypothetical protein